MDEKNIKLIGELNQWIREKQDKNEEKNGGYMFYFSVGAILLLTYGGAMASYYFSNPQRSKSSVQLEQSNIIFPSQPIPTVIPPKVNAPRDFKGKSKKRPAKAFEHKQDQFGYYTYEDSDY